MGLRSQLVAATHWPNRSADVSYSRIIRGRSLNSSAGFNFAWIWTHRSVPLGSTDVAIDWCSHSFLAAKDFADHRSKHRHIIMGVIARELLRIAMSLEPSSLSAFPHEQILAKNHRDIYRPKSCTCL